MFKKLVNLFFVNRCAVCKKPCRDAICKDCLKGVKPLDLGCCHKCGKPIHSCICKDLKVHFEKCVSAYRYEQSAISSAIYKLKEKGNRQVVWFFADAMVLRLNDQYNNTKFDFVTFVPTTRKKKRAKGFDHAEILAKAVSKRIGVKCVAPPFKRKGKSAQKYLSRAVRDKNAESAFVLNGKTICGRVLLVDDVITTGVTLSYAAGLVKKAGANEIYCLTAATSTKK